MVKRKPFPLVKRFPFLQRLQFSISKRHRFVISVLLLSGGLFWSYTSVRNYNFWASFLLGILADILFFISMYKDLKGNKNIQMFILPFMFTVAFGLIHYLTPSRFLSRFILTTLYGVGIYSLFLSQNIFIVASIRTIALLKGARIVSLIIAVISYLLLSDIIFSLHLPNIIAVIGLFIPAILIFVISFLLMLHATWEITLEKSIQKNVLWAFAIGVVLAEISLPLWFWPTLPIVISIFLTGFFYTIVSLSQVWNDRRLFRGVLWEYVWIPVIAFFILIWFTSWKG